MSAETDVATSEIDQLRAEVQALRDSVAALTEMVAHTRDLAVETRSLVGPFGVNMPDGSMLVQTIHGTKYLIDPNDRVMAPQLIVYRQWEPELSRLFLHSLSADSVVIDVGANFGYFTCLAGNRIGTNGRGQVWSFEPNPRLLPLLRDNCRINWSMAPIHIRPVAVGSRTGTATLSIPADGAANASLSDWDGDQDKVEVEIVTLDDAIPREVTVDLMKIDVEGHELAVLEGARNLIGRSPDLHIVMEWSLEQMIAAGNTADAVIRLIHEAGLATKSIPGSGRLEDAEGFDPEALRSMRYDNIILAKR